MQASIRKLKYVIVSSQTSNEKKTFLRVKSTHCNALEKIFLRRKTELVKVEVFELVFLQKTTFFNALKYAIFTRKSVVFCLLVFLGSATISL